MCACRCGINVHMKDGKVAYIEGNRDHPVNRGVLCAKGSAGIMQHYAPSRLRAPLKRVGPRGSGEFEEISWDEALETRHRLAETDPRDRPEKLAFFTGRDQSPASPASGRSLRHAELRRPWRVLLGQHGGGRHLHDGRRVLGVRPARLGPHQAVHDLRRGRGPRQQPDQDGLGKLKARGAKVIGVNPIRTGYNAVADEWVGITPGTDGLFILSLIHCC
jgi:anaerobic selenocysteine-containing dehydrogenase